ncbi:uncharacterized protein METZ01_LOCUS175337 [marine metagenome]|uniref:Uncharacterized protein n=1 Tax=marine metagenome TaxID=408172 RepID=A0A382CB44_9ZZZZ
MANRFPLVVDSTNSNIRELPSGDNLDLTGSSIVLGGTTVTANGEELNLLDNVSGLVQADFTKLAAVTSTDAELNLLAGVSGLAQSDFTKLAAVDATAVELNYLDINTLGLTQASRAVTADANGIVKFGDGIQEAYTDLTSGTTVALDLNVGTVFNLTLEHDVGTFNWTNYAGADYASAFVLRVKQDGTGDWSLAWPAGVDWAAGTAPELSTAANAVDVFVFLGVNNLDGGTLWHGFTAGQAFA